MSIENMYCNESQESLSSQLLFEASLFRFHSASALQYLDYYYNEYSVKQAAPLYLKLPLKPVFFVCVLLFSER